MLESGAMDEMGEWQAGQDWRRGLEAYRERLAEKHKIRENLASTPLNSSRKERA